MIYKYSNFVLTNEKNTITYKYNYNLYWYDDNFKELLNNDWNNIIINEYKQKVKNFNKLYKIIFSTKESNDKSYSVLIENKGNEDYYLLDDSNDSIATKIFVEKLKKEFEKNKEYALNFKYDPKCLGKLDYIRDKENYNI